MKATVSIVLAITFLGLGCASAPRYTNEDRPVRQLPPGNTASEPTGPNQSQQNEIPVSAPGGKAAAIQPEVGLATFTGRERQGLPTASGELYDFQQLTAGHRFLPFNTIVKVTNMENGLTIQLRINDRGPNIPNRIIDLSYESAKRLEILKEGVAIVRIEVMQLP